MRRTNTSLDRHQHHERNNPSIIFERGSSGLRPSPSKLLRSRRSSRKNKSNSCASSKQRGCYSFIGLLALFVTFAVHNILFLGNEDNLLLQNGRSSPTEPASVSVPAQNPVTAAVPVIPNTDISDKSENKQCSIFMAPSSLKGHSGFGIYTTRDIPKDSEILNGPDGPSIPVIDYDSGPNNRWRKQWLDLFDDYWWGRGVPDHVTYEADSVMDYQITFGSLPNHHCLLSAIKTAYPEIAYNDGLFNRFTDPGAGAVSYARGRAFQVKRDVKANEELFLNYGHCEREEGVTDWTSQIPMPEDYDAAAAIILSYWKAQANKPKNKVPVPPGTDKRVASLIPEDTETLMKIMDFDDDSKKKGVRQKLKKQLARHVASTPRSANWIRSNGVCLEHLVPGKSRIPQAGQGGFAQHWIRKGEMVVPAPMMQILNRDVLLVFDDKGKRTGTQLLLNYCLGHPKSSMLLCPNTNAILVNHCSTRTKDCGPEGPNAVYQWSSGWDPTSEIWQNMTLKEIGGQTGRGLSMEIVALRDIAPGEEVFIDYGIEWEEAWDKHVSEWRAPNAVKGWLTAQEANENKISTLEKVATNDLRSVADHPHLFTGCFYRESFADNHEVYQSEESQWPTWNDTKILDWFSDPAGWKEENHKYSTHNDQSYWPCSIIRKDDDDKGTFTVRIHQSLWYDQQIWDENDLPRLITKFPSESIQFFVKPYEGDQHLENAFRHPVGFPSDIFPNIWKNREDVVLYKFWKQKK